MESVSSYSLRANKLCLILACASLLFFPSHVVAAIASSVSRLAVDRPGNSELLADLDHQAESVDATSSGAESYIAAAVVPENERPQSLQALLRMGAGKHLSDLIKGGHRKLFAKSPPTTMIPLVPSPPAPTDPGSAPTTHW